MPLPACPIPKNEYEISEDGTVSLHLGHGQIALINVDDLALVAHRKWHARKGGHTYYAYYNWRPGGGRDSKTETVLLHRLIMGLTAGSPEFVDHINHNGLDNRRDNLRVVTPYENTQNRRPSNSNGRTGYRGVVQRSPLTAKNPFEARIRKDGKQIHLGMFPTAIDAARAYDAARRKLHHGVGPLNFPDE